jgi:hypothetical protein
MTATKSDGASEFRGPATTKLLNTIASTLQVTDLIALLMVFVTALSVLTSEPSRSTSSMRRVQK